MTRRGYLTLGAVSLAASAVQVGHLATTTDRSWMTMLPLIVGTLFAYNDWANRRLHSATFAV